MLLPEDSPAKTYQRQDKERELLMEKEALYGGRCYDLLASYDQNTCSLKMSQACLVEMVADGFQNSCQTWPPSGMMQNGIVYQLPTLGQATSANVFGLLPTPTKSDGSSPSLKKSLRKEETWESNSSLTAVFLRYFLGLKGKEKVSGTFVINPCITEIMMGYPIGWTE